MTENHTVYALPGTMCDERIWIKLKEQRLNFSLQHVDIPLGESIDSIIQTLENSMPEKPIHLLGFSLGGYIASAFCSKNPHRIKQLAVLANLPAALPSEEVEQREQVIKAVEKHGYQGIPENKIKPLLHEDNAEKTEIIELIREMDEECGEQMLLNQLKATTYRSDLSMALAATNVEVSFIYGRQDKLVNKLKLDSLANMFANVSSHTVETAGHMLPLESAESLAVILNNFFNENRQDSAPLSE